MGQLRSYDHPNFLIRREHTIHNEAIAASATLAFAFRVAQGAIVTAVNIICRSTPTSEPSLTFVRYVGVTASTIASILLSANVSAGSLPTSAPTVNTLTFLSSNTLLSITDVIGAIASQAAAGNYDIVYEYYVLPGGSYTGSN